MDESLEQLRDQLIRLHHHLRDETREKYGRINPFNEDLFNWKERGEYFFGEGKNITAYNTCTILGDVEVGENCWLGPYTTIDGSASVKIGRGCSISSLVNIVSHDSVRWALSNGKLPYEKAPIVIGDNCYIGTGALITKGVTIGKHCLVGAGAVVTKDIPDYGVAFGVPARVVGKVILTDDDVQIEYFKRGEESRE